MARLKISMPTLSVPKRCWALGGSRKLIESAWIGEYGAISGAKIASNITIATIIYPAAKRGLIRATFQNTPSFESMNPPFNGSASPVCSGEAEFNCYPR
jgi:hypothetical protein